MKHIGDQEEEVGGDGVTLPQAFADREPTDGDPIEQRRRHRGPKDEIHPVTPGSWEPPHLHASPEAGPGDRVEGLGEVELEHQRGAPPLMAALHQLRRVDGVLRDAMPGQEAGLVLVDEGADLSLEPRRQALAEDFHVPVLERDGMEIPGSRHAFLFGQQGDEGPVDSVEAR